MSAPVYLCVWIAACTCVSECVSAQVYEMTQLIDARPVVSGSMAALNEATPHKALQLVLFDDALRHLIRIARVIGAPRGNAILIGTRSFVFTDQMNYSPLTTRVQVWVAVGSSH